MSMGADFGQDSGTAPLDAISDKEQHVHIAGIKAMIMASRTYGREIVAEHDDGPFYGRWCDQLVGVDEMVAP